MPVETATYVSQLNASYPLGSDNSGDGDNHLRMLKNVLKAQFPEFTAAALNATQAEVEAAIAAVTGLGQILLQDGSAADPAAAFASDDNTGFYWGGDGYINFACNGVYAGKFGPGGTLNLVGRITALDYPFPSGTAMLFQQTAAPTGWTKSATHNDKTLRVVSGTVGSGGSVAFSTLFGRTATDGTALTAGQMPVHTHGVTDPGHYHTNSATVGTSSQNINPSGVTSVPSNLIGTFNTDTKTTGITLQNAGSGEAHSHNIDMRVTYVDVIIATKD